MKVNVTEVEGFSDKRRSSRLRVRRSRDKVERVRQGETTGTMAFREENGRIRESKKRITIRFSIPRSKDTRQEEEDMKTIRQGDA
jgi:hypothetical protein